MRRRVWIPFLVVLLPSCAGGGDGNDGGNGGGRPVELSYSFAADTQGFTAGFADVPPGVEADWEMLAELRALPPELGSDANGYYLQGNNHSDDMFMFVARKVDGLDPGAEYTAEFAIRFASNAQSGCLGVGGSPGESVVLKVGAVGYEPEVSVPAGDDHLRIDIDKGDVSSGGDDVSLVGPIANGLPCDPDEDPYVSMRETHDHPLPVMTSPAGELWLIVGTDSGFEALTGIYYLSIGAILTPTE